MYSLKELTLSKRRTPSGKASLIVDMTSCLILNSTYKSPKTAYQIIEETGIPKVSAYRKIRLLTIAGFLEIIPPKKGTRLLLYKSRTREIKLVFGKKQFDAIFLSS